jgi:CubicO group peptidase (beta-lactamase class C family)
LKENEIMTTLSTTTLRTALAALAIFASSASAAQPAKKLIPIPGLVLVPPGTVGLSTERVERITKTMQRYVAEGRVAGTVTYLMRRGKLVHFEATGMADIEGKVPMQKDTIFRIASMSKAVTSVAAMILIEEGLLSLETPVSRYFAGFKKTTVALNPPTGAVAGSPAIIVPSKREITVRDLLTHTAGISYGLGPGAALWKAAGIQGWYLADRAEPIASVVERMAALPFDAQPGEAFVYGYGTDILGAVVEKASGKPLDVFFRERIFEPLKMVDTSFFLPPEKRARLAAVYMPKEDGTIMRAPDTAPMTNGAMVAQGAYVDGPRQCFGGGAGLLSTAPDYSRLVRMFANGGALDGVRILGPKTVALMSSNFVGNLYNEGRTGFGLGFEVVEHMGRSGRYGSEGAFGWGSAYYANYWVDPQEDMLGLYFSQYLPYTGMDLQQKFRTLAYAAIETLGK